MLLSGAIFVTFWEAWVCLTQHKSSLRLADLSLFGSPPWIIAYASSWLKCHHPDVFCAALLNAQPMGFYAPAQIVRDAAEHGVEIRPVCVNTSRWDCTLEVSLRQRPPFIVFGIEADFQRFNVVVESFHERDNGQKFAGKASAQSVA
jgi:DNA polymerase III alpha subunit